MKRANNKILVIVLMVLAVAFVLTKLFRAPSRERTINDTLMTFDTSKVTGIDIRPKGAPEIKLTRSGNAWQLQSEKRHGNIEMSQVRTTLGALAKVQTDRVLTRNKANWSNYNVDSTGTQVKVTSGQNTKQFWVGKLSNGGSSLRIEGEDDVYAVDGAIERTFNKNFNEWRNKTFVQVQPEKISKVVFQYPGDSSFVLSRPGGKWEIDNAKPDSAKVQSYLNRFRFRTLQHFADDFTPSGAPTYTVTLHSQAGDTISIQGWKVAGDRWILHSSQQKDVYFSSTDGSLVRDLFPPTNLP